jgi:calmodulin
MQLVYLRYGRAQLDAQLEAVFGTSDLNSGNTLSLTDFLAHLHANQARTARAHRQAECCALC